MTQPRSIDSILIIGFGGPTAPDEIRAFLQNVVRGRNVPAERLEEVAHHYEEIGGRSPYNDWTFRQAEALQALLAEDDGPLRGLPVYVGMRNWHPYLHETVARMAAEGHRSAAGFVLAAQRSQTSWERYLLDVDRAREQAGAELAVSYHGGWHTHPLFVEAMAARIEEASAYGRGEWPENVPLVFTAHSIPVSMAGTSRYAEEVEESSRAVAETLGAARWSVAWQSASGDGRVPWLTPDVNDVMRELGAQAVREIVMYPVGFLCDHVEVLFDLDVEAKATAAEVGVKLVRAQTVGDHPAFIRMIAEVLREAVGG